MGALPRYSLDDHATVPLMLELTPEDEQDLIRDIATRAGTAAEIASWYGFTKAELSAYVEAHRPQLERAREKAEAPPELPAEPSPVELDELWITNKHERIKRAQECADILYRDIRANSYEGAELATALREFRSYCVWVSNELGQLMHRGAGDAGTGDSLAIELDGVNLDTMR